MTTKPAWNPIDHPIINSPYEEPRWHWKLDGRGVAQPELLPGRRQSMGISPVPQSKTPKTATLFDDPKEELILVNNLRTLVSRWRRQDYPDVTSATKQLLDHWNSDQTDPRLFFTQNQLKPDARRKTVPLTSQRAHQTCQDTGETQSRATRGGKI